jgi:hypothetical protein
MRRRKRKRKMLRKGKEKIVYHAQEVVSVRGSLTISFLFFICIDLFIFCSFLQFGF